MCFDHDYYPEFSDWSVVKCRKPHQCEECGKTIPSGELAEHHTGQFDGEFFSTYLCGSCEATRHKVHKHELAEGCRGSETWCPVGELHEYCKDHEIEFATADEGRAFLRAKRDCDQARKAAAIRIT